MKLSKEIQDVYEKSTCIYPKEEIEAAFDRMAKEMGERLADTNPVFLCVLLGGIVPLGNLLTRLDFQMEINYLHVSSYGIKNRIGELHWKAEPTIDIAGRTVVIVDDILDTGITLRELLDYCKEKQAKDVYTAVMLDKRKPRKPGGVESADFTALSIEDLFVFGYGLDYSEYLRNLPGIYAIKPDDK